MNACVDLALLDGFYAVSLLPPENATGNFTKIVQRLPVRIRLTPNEEGGVEENTAEAVLRPGMSVVVSFDSRGGK